MKIIHRVYPAGPAVPVDRYLKNKKFRKYFNRETCAAVAVIGEFLSLTSVDTSKTPLYYATGIIEYEDYGLDRIVEKSLENGKFSDRRFVEEGIACVSPLDQFKVLLNMPLSFIAIEFGFKADNAVIYSSASGLLSAALSSTADVPVFAGSGGTYPDGSVEAGFMLATRDELRSIKIDNPDEEAVLLLRRIAQSGGCA